MVKCHSVRSDRTVYLPIFVRSVWLHGLLTDVSSAFAWLILSAKPCSSLFIRMLVPMTRDSGVARLNKLVIRMKQKGLFWFQTSTKDAGWEPSCCGELFQFAS